MKRSIAVLFSFSLLLVAGCALNPFAQDPIAQARKATPTGSAFNQALYRAYLARAEEKLQVGQRKSANYFAARATAAAGGKAILPVDLKDNVPKDLGGARSDLVKYLVDGGRDKAPEESAQSQSYFDCWAKATQGKNTAEVTRCKGAFEKALSNLQVALNATPGSVASKGGAGKQASAADTRRDYRVYFGFDEWHLTAAALDTITKAIDTARTEGQSQIVNSGYADRAGPAAYNMKLSRRRAQVVKDTMVEMGARAGAVEVKAYGETHLAVKTPNGVREPKNRRVEIALIP
jgi:outer membrane protein OmpA-like peptidoglycan-associated protein